MLLRYHRAGGVEDDVAAVFTRGNGVLVDMPFAGALPTAPTIDAYPLR